MDKSEKKPGVAHRLMEETKTILLVSVYLALLLGALATYRMLILAEYEVRYVRYGFSLVESLVLAKVIVFGRLLRLGERYDDRPLIIPTLYKTAIFGVFVLGFSIVEHLFIGWWRGKGPAEILNEILSKGIWEILAHLLVLFMALLPLFAIWETDRVLGKGKLFQLFFRRNADVTLEVAAGPTVNPA